MIYHLNQHTPRMHTPARALTYSLHDDREGDRLLPPAATAAAAPALPRLLELDAPLEAALVVIPPPQRRAKHASPHIAAAAAPTAAAAPAPAAPAPVHLSKWRDGCGRREI